MTDTKAKYVLMASASRDGECKLWSVDEADGNAVGFLGTHHEHKHFVNAVCFVEGGEAHHGGLVASGGADNLIHLMDVNTYGITGVLRGHAKNVCALASHGQRILSGSWDSTATVWEGQNPLWTLIGHGNAVWAVQFVDGETFLTASADKSIKLWKRDRCIRTFVGHTDCVRALLLLEGDRFLSASNDGSIRLWSLDSGQQLACIDKAHDSFIYALDSLGGDRFISSGEDRCVKVWSLATLACQQSIPVPAESVWTVRGISADTFACGTSDGYIYLFSSESAKQMADEALLAIFQERLATSRIPKATAGDAPVQDGAPSEPGRYVGENRMVRTPDGTKVEAYQWDGHAWIMIGEVIDSEVPATKQEHLGQHYDHVFDVQVEDGGATLRLPYNRSENPYSAAQRFIADNGLDPGYVEQVVDFILKNTPQQETGEQKTELFNPYMQSSTQAKAKSEQPKELLATEPVRLAAANLDGIQKKILEFNGQLPAAQQIKASALQTVISRLKDSAQRIRDSAAVQGLMAAFAQWPMDRLFPVLDLARMMALDETGLAPHVAPLLTEVVLKHSLAVAEDPKISQANTLMQLRTLTNALQSKALTEGVLSTRLAELATLLRSLSMSPLLAAKDPALPYQGLLNLALACAKGAVQGDAGKYLLSLLLEKMRSIDESSEETLILFLSAINALKDRLSAQHLAMLAPELSILLARPNLSERSMQAIELLMTLLTTKS